MAQLVPQQLLSAAAAEIRLARRKGNAVALRNSFRAGVFHRLALIELYAGQIRPESALHSRAHGLGQVNPMSELRARRLRGAAAQRV